MSTHDPRDDGGFYPSTGSDSLEAAVERRTADRIADFIEEGLRACADLDRIGARPRLSDDVVRAYLSLITDIRAGRWRR